MNNNTEWEELIQQTKNIEASENAPKLSIIDEAKKKNKENGKNFCNVYSLIFYNIFKEEESKVEQNEWIPTQYEKLVSMMRKANLIKDNRVSLTKTYRNSFKGEDFIGWIMREKKIRRSEALELGQELIEKHFNDQMSHEEAFSFDPDRYYLIVDETTSGPLNCTKLPTNKFPTDLGEFNEILKNFIDPIYDAILDESKKRIFIERLEDNLDFKHYMILMREAVNLNIEKATLESRLAFFTNCFNMQLIHITYKCGLPTTIWQRRRYFYSIYYQLGGHSYSLQSIFNGILRGNQKGYGMLWKPFGKQDQRRPNVAEEMYLNAQRHFESDAYLRIDCKKSIICLAKLFKIYAKDFGTGNEAILEWIIDVMKPGPKREDLLKLYYAGQYTISYLPIDFTLNFIRDENM
uniref:DEP domain-containing protein n=1 Tax=Panagrolaimus superbus TaxID=310955 RepID=A0A914YQN5_9BILA